MRADVKAKIWGLLVENEDGWLFGLRVKSMGVLSFWNTQHELDAVCSFSQYLQSLSEE